MPLHFWPGSDIRKMFFPNLTFWGRGGGGQVVSVLAFYSVNLSSNPAEVYIFSVKLLLKRTKRKKKEAGIGPIKI